jgi:hypothetical protein
MKLLISACGGGVAGFGAGGEDASRDQFRRALAAHLPGLGEVELVDSATEAVRRARRTGARHLCLAYPHELPAEAGSETVPMFGLGFADCPTDALWGDQVADWRSTLGRTAGVACLSSHTKDAVRRLMGDGLPLALVPPPLPVAENPVPPAPQALRLQGSLLDTGLWTDTALPAGTGSSPVAAPAESGPAGLRTGAPGAAEDPWRKTMRYRLGTIRLHLRAIYREAICDLLPPPAARAAAWLGAAATRAGRRLLAAPHRPAGATGKAELHPDWRFGSLTVTLDGVVFAAVHGVWDRSWGDLLPGFVAACRSDPYSVLAIRTSRLDEFSRGQFAATLRRLGPFSCRVVILDGEIEGGLAPLIAASSFYVCASHSEAAPLPMMRFLAAGRPAISPTHSALSDLLDERSGFVVAAGPEYDAFPGDRRERLLATAWRLDWESLCAGITGARALADCPAAYRALSLKTADRMRTFCAPEIVLQALAALLDEPGRADRPAAAPSAVTEDAARAAA